MRGVYSDALVSIVVFFIDGKFNGKDDPLSDVNVAISRQSVRGCDFYVS